MTLPNKSDPMTSLNYPQLPYYNVSADQSEAEVWMPGFSYDDIDRVGNVHIWKLARVLEGMRILPLRRTTPAFLDFLETDKHYMVLATAAKYTIYEPFYSQGQLYQLLRGHVALERFGNTSLILSQVLYDVDGNKITDLLHTLTLVSRTTRKACKIPPEMLEKLGHLCKKEYPPLRVEIKEPPETAHTSAPYTPAYSDMDFYFHTNHSTYLRRCIDIITELALKNKLTVIKGDIAYLHIKDIAAVFRAETDPGHILHISTWEDPDNPLKIYGSIFRGENLVYHQYVEFNPTTNFTEWNNGQKI